MTSSSDIKGSTTQIPLFVDGASAALYTGSFDGGSQLTGFAQRIAVNPAVVGSAGSLVGITGTGAGSSTGDGTRPQALYSALTGTQRLFSSSSGISGIDAPTRSSVADFVQGVISVQGAAAAAAQDLDEGQSIALSTAQGRFASASGLTTPWFSAAASAPLSLSPGTVTLRSWIFMTLDDATVVPFERLDAMADKLMELAQANHHRLVRS